MNTTQVIPSKADGLYTPVGSGPDATTMANMPTTAGGMRGLGLVALILAQIYLKLETVKLAKNYYKTNRKDFTNFQATHQPGAIASVEEAMSPVTNPEYAVDTYASSPAGISKSKIVDIGWFSARRRIHRYAVGAQQRLDYDMAKLRASAVATGWNMGRRYEQAWTDAHNERRFNRQLAMANLGIATGNIVRQGLATAVSNVMDARTGLSNTIGSIGNGYARKMGYEDGRREIREQYNKD
jgi:hypothetical protein